MKPESRLILVGMMGAGKTTVGRLLAKHLKRSFYDTDEEIDNVNSARTPFLGDLPYIGFLFRNTTTVRNKSELLIFITPRIMNERLTGR